MMRSAIGEAWRRRISRRVQAEREGADDGFTLIELMVSIGLMAIISISFLVATNTVYHGIHKEQGIVDATDGNRRALTVLDKQVRYASAINTPGTAADGNFYLEYKWTKSSPGTVDVSACSQWRLDPVNDVLQWRSWTSGITPTARPVFVTVDTGVVNVPATTPPFSLTPLVVVTPPAGVAPVILQFQELRVTLVAKRDQGNVTSTSTLTAQNSPGSAPLATPVCQEVSRAS
jgi:prepilin-type N-terminal cleavage/methylation domain-containing protein